jgi:hypothetical protein
LRPGLVFLPHGIGLEQKLKSTLLSLKFVFLLDCGQSRFVSCLQQIGCPTI